ncbi:MAG: hypothetical protein GC171_05400 [Terrimonas sp.]|nr:hypothetical protein [Terrimonas sp.]
MKRNKILTALALLTSVITLNSCYYDIEEELYPAGNSNCDTTGVTYSNTVAPIMQSLCISCHSTSLPSGNITLDTYAAVKTQALNGKLYGSINHSAGYVPMPQGGNKMNSCLVNRIKSWVDGGAINN